MRWLERGLQRIVNAYGRSLSPEDSTFIAFPLSRFAPRGHRLSEYSVLVPVSCDAGDGTRAHDGSYLQRMRRHGTGVLLPPALQQYVPTEAYAPPSSVTIIPLPEVRR